MDFDVGLVSAALNGGLVEFDDFFGLGEKRGSLSRDFFSLFLGLLLFLVVFLDSLHEVLTAARQADVLDSGMESLLDFTVSNDLVEDDADRSGVDVEDPTSSTVVRVVGHSLMDRSVDSKGCKIADLELAKVGSDFDRSVTAERLVELSASAPSVSLRVSHPL